MSIAELKAWNRKATQSLSVGESFGVPYRCLTPKGLANVLVAGRCVSTDREANGSVRIMACCLNTGEAAGIAAAMAVAGSQNVHAVDVRELRRKLQAHGAFLPDCEDTRPLQEPHVANRAAGVGSSGHRLTRTTNE